MITESELKQFVPGIPDQLVPIVAKWFNYYCDKYGVNTPLRMAAFFSQVGHESINFKYTQEIASGSAYEGRKDLGNLFKGDGKKFRGRGYIQVTGRSNTREVSVYIFGDTRLENTPELLASPQYAMLSAFWYWETRNLNKWADIGFLKTITKKINGGLTNWADRLKRYDHIMDVLGLPHWTE